MYSILDMTTGNRLGLPHGEPARIDETVHRLNREYPQGRFTLVRPPEKHPGL